MAEFLDDLFSSPINMIALATTVLVVVAGLGYLVLRPKFFRLMLKNLGRNPVRTSLIGLASAVLVMSVTLVWTIIYDLDLALRERSKDFKLIVTERWQLPSQIPIKHADYLDPRSPSFLPELVGKYGQKDFMTWSFYGGSVDPTKRTAQNILFFFAMDPDHIKTMMDDLDTYDDAIIAKLKATRNGCLLGQDRLRKLNLEVGGTFMVYSLNYKGIVLDFEIVGALPAGRYDPNAIMRADYFQGAFDEYERKNRKPHFMQAPDDRRLNLIWMRVPDRAAFNEIGELVIERFYPEQRAASQPPPGLIFAPSEHTSPRGLFRDTFDFRADMRAEFLRRRADHFEAHAVELLRHLRRMDRSTRHQARYPPGHPSHPWPNGPLQHQ